MIYYVQRTIYDKCSENWVGGLGSRVVVVSIVILKVVFVIEFLRSQVRQKH